MQMTGEQRVAAPRGRVWDALNDPAVLAQCIPGCQSLDKEADDRFVAVAQVKVGPIGARFRGQVQLSDLDAPNGCTINGSGNGGIAGNAKGNAKVRLSDIGDGDTLVRYEVEADVGGRMAQLGGPILDATARNLAGTFFTRFGEVVGGGAPAPVAAGEQAIGAGQTSTPARQPLPVHASAADSVSTRRALWGWVAAVLLALVTGFALGVRAAPAEMLVAAALLVVTAAAAFETGRRSTAR